VIDPRADVHPSAELDSSVEVGPFSVIGANVRIGAGTRIGPHVVVRGPTEIGRDNRIFQFSSIGEDPQDTSYQGEPTRLVIGDRNVIRESVTLNRGTEKGNGETVIGHDNLIMAYVHVAHDCTVGNQVIFSNATSLAGHVEIEDHATLGGFTLVHQFCRVGSYAFTSMGSALNRDLPPFCLASGNYARLVGINKVGLRRNGFSDDVIRALHRTFIRGMRGRSGRERNLDELFNETEIPEVHRLIDFVRGSQRGILRAGRSG